MKFIQTYKLYESKNVGLLYHFTSIENLIEIINSIEFMFRTFLYYHNIRS